MQGTRRKPFWDTILAAQRRDFYQQTDQRLPTAISLAGGRAEASSQRDGGAVMILFPRRPERELRVPSAATPCRGYFMGNHDLVSDSFLALTGVGLVLLSSSLLAFVFT